MKILMAGDTHGYLGHTQYLVRTAATKECDALFVLGDFGYWEHQKPGVTFLNELNAYSQNRDVAVYFLDGNHDKTSLLMEKYGDNRDDEGFVVVRDNIFYAPRGHRWTWANNTRFAAFGGAYSVDKDWRVDAECAAMLPTAPPGARCQKQHKHKYQPESLWFPEEEMSDEDMDQFLEDQTPVDVMLTHDKPRGSNPKWNRKDLEECWPNADRIQRAVKALNPKVLFHGHLHYFYTEEMWHSSTHDADLHATYVISLLCNPEAGESGLYTNKTLSWQVFDTADAWWRGVNTP